MGRDVRRSRLPFTSRTKARRSPHVNRTAADALSRVAGAFNLPLRAPDFLVSVAGQGNREMSMTRIGHKTSAFWAALAYGIIIGWPLACAGSEASGDSDFGSPPITLTRSTTY